MSDKHICGGSLYAWSGSFVIMLMSNRDCYIHTTALIVLISDYWYVSAH